MLDKVKLKIMEILLKVKESKSFEEVKYYNNELKKIDLENRKMEIAKKALQRYKNY